MVVMEKAEMIKPDLAVWRGSLTNPPTKTNPSGYISALDQPFLRWQHKSSLTPSKISAARAFGLGAGTVSTPPLPGGPVSEILTSFLVVSRARVSQAQ